LIRAETNKHNTLLSKALPFSLYNTANTPHAFSTSYPGQPSYDQGTADQCHPEAAPYFYSVVHDSERRINFLAISTIHLGHHILRPPQFLPTVRTEILAILKKNPTTEARFSTRATYS